MIRSKLNLSLPTNWLSWISLSLLVKFLILFFFYTAFYSSIHPPGWMGLANVNADFDDFYLPVYHFIHHGISEYVSGSGLPYAGRFPGFAVPTYFFLLALPESIAIQGIVLLQLIYSVVATYLLARLVYKITGSLGLFLLTLLIFVVFPVFLQFEITFHPDSYTNSAFITALYFGYNYSRERKKQSLFFCGLFFTWALLMRPYLLPYLFAFGGISALWMWKEKKFVFAICATLFVFFSPFLAFETFWITRNYRAYHQVIPLVLVYEHTANRMTPAFPNTTSYPVEKLRELISSWGGDNVWYQRGGEMNWFMRMSDTEANQFRLPPRIFTTAYNLDSLKLLRIRMHRIEQPDISPEELARTESQVIRSTEKFTQTYRTEHWVWYRFASPFLRIKNLIFRNPVQDWPGPSFANSGMVYKAYKICSAGCYLLISIFVFPACVCLIRKYKKLTLFEASVLGCFVALLVEFAYLINLSHLTYFFTGYIAAYLLILLAWKQCILRSTTPASDRGNV
jgi:hypothetical protein